MEDTLSERREKKFARFGGLLLIVDSFTSRYPNPTCSRYSQSASTVAADISEFDFTMNWTGGRLQRHSKDSAKSTDLAKQKQHFAAVRQRLHNGETAQETPFRPSFLVRDGLTLANGVTPFGHGSQRHTGHSKGHQTSLDEYSSTAPLVQRLTSMQKRSAVSKNPPARQKKLPSRRHHHSGETGRPQVKYETTGQDDSAPQAQGHAANNSFQQSASPDPARSRLRPEDLLELSRKKLLSQNDWIGLNHSRPVTIHFTSRHDKERIGKRRKIDSGIEQRRRMLGKLKRGDDAYGRAVNAQPPFMSGALGVVPESISVRIGDHALSTQVSTAPHESVRLREDFEHVRQSSESMLFDVEQLQLSQPQRLGLTEEGVEQEHSGTQTIPQRDAFGSHTVPVCISDDTDTSKDSASSLDENEARELEAMEGTDEAAIEEGLEVQQLLDQFNRQDNDDGQHEDDQEYSPILPVRDPHPKPAPFRLVFESSLYHHDALPPGSPSELGLGDEINESCAHRFDKFSPLPDAEEDVDAVPKFVNVHAAEADQAQSLGSDEVEPSESNVRDDDAPWRKMFSNPSSNPGFLMEDFNAEDVDSGHGSGPSLRTSLATNRDAEFKTLGSVQSRYEAESSASVYNSPSASFRMISMLAAQPQQDKSLTTSKNMQASHAFIETKHSDPNEYWRKFVFDDDDDDNENDAEDEEEEDDRTTAAQYSVSAWPSSGKTQNSRSRKPKAGSKSSMENNASTSDASFPFRARADPGIREQQHSSKARASGSAAPSLLLKNNVPNLQRRHGRSGCAREEQQRPRTQRQAQ